MKYSELHRKLRKAGCYVKREGKRHPIWYSPITGKEFPTGRHEAREVSIGVLNSVRDSSGVDL